LKNPQKKFKFKSHALEREGRLKSSEEETGHVTPVVSFNGIGALWNKYQIEAGIQK